MIPIQIYGSIKEQGGFLRMGMRGEATINRRDSNVYDRNNLRSGIPAEFSDIVVIQFQLETEKTVKDIAK